MRSVLFAAMIAAMATLAPGIARAQVESREGIALQNQILELRRDVQSLQSQGRSSSLGSAPSYTAPSGGGNDMVATLLDRVSRLQDEVRDLRGRLDETNNALQRQNDDLTKQIGDLSFRLDNGGAGGAGSPGPAPRAPSSPPTLSPPSGNLGTLPVTPPAAPAKRTPELAMQEGNAALARRDYNAAESSARDVLAVPRTTRANDASFLLAQALAGKRDYANAAVAYDDSYSRARTGAHAPDALLGLANALNALGDKRASCASLDKLRVEFPTLRQDLRDPVAAARQKSGCR